MFCAGYWYVSGHSRKWACSPRVYPATIVDCILSTERLEACGLSFCLAQHSDICFWHALTKSSNLLGAFWHRTDGGLWNRRRRLAVDDRFHLPHLASKIGLGIGLAALLPYVELLRVEDLNKGELLSRRFARRLRNPVWSFGKCAKCASSRKAILVPRTDRW